MAASEWIVEEDRPGRERADHRAGPAETRLEDWLPRTDLPGPGGSFAERARRVEAQLQEVGRRLDEAFDRSEWIQPPRP